MRPFKFDSTFIEPYIAKSGKPYLCPHTEGGLDILVFDAVPVEVSVTLTFKLA